jgi:hypothetical protein
MPKKYIWLNPIVEAMLHETGNVAGRVLEEKGYSIISCISGAPRIHEAYRYYVKNAVNKPVIDARCPKITALIEKRYPQLEGNIAPIPPILIACTEELYKKYIEPDSEAATLTVIAPCSWLVGKGISVWGAKVRFHTWREFSCENGLGEYPQLQVSPVPPGFFKGLNLQVLEANGSQSAETLLELAYTGLLPQGTSLLELLYCEGGCHRGDGF